MWGRHGGDMARYAGDMTSTTMCDGAMSRPASVCTSAGHLRGRNGRPWSLRKERTFVCTSAGHVAEKSRLCLSCRMCPRIAEI